MFSENNWIEKCVLIQFHYFSILFFKLWCMNVRANLRGRDIFNDSDAIFLRGFDDRVLYRKTIPAMVKMMAGHLRSRNGNILAAAAGYNAGLSRTASWGLYKPFGRIPDISETAGYISKILVNHFAITKRL